MLALLVLLSVSLPAHAFFNPPWIAPESPLAGDSISINVRHGKCDSILVREGFPRITKDGNNIHVVYYGVHYELGDELCIFGIGTVTTEVGAFPPGTYSLSIDLLYQHPVFGPTILNVGAVSFTVAARPKPASVPTINSLGALALTTLLIVAIWLRRTRLARKKLSRRSAEAAEALHT